MSGELTLNQFRYTTTNNRDFVIGDPSDTNEQPRYMVFQVNSTPGYANNPHIKAEKVGDNWQISISEDGATPLNFAFIDRENYFTYPNHFQAPTTFTSDVEINANLTVQGQAFTPSLVGYLAGNNIFTGYNTFTKDAIFDGTLTVQGRILNTNKSILLNSGAATSSAVGAGFDVSGDSGDVIAYVRNTASGMTIKSTGLQPINLTGDATFGYTIKPAAALTRASSYVLPVQSTDTTSIVTAPITSGTAPFTATQSVIVNSDTGHVIQSDVTLAELQHLRTADDFFIRKNGDTLDGKTFTYTSSKLICEDNTKIQLDSTSTIAFGVPTSPDIFIQKLTSGVLKISGTGVIAGLANQAELDVNFVKADYLVGDGSSIINVNADSLNGKPQSYYDCNGTCSWTCMATCKGSCSTTCTGACMTSCTAACGGNCTGTCATLCTGTCSGTCSSTCTGSCMSTCTVVCGGNCTGTCKGGCTSCSGCTSCTSCSGSCSGHSSR